MSKRRLIAIIGALLVIPAILLASVTAATASSGDSGRAKLGGYQEVPAVSTQARGQIHVQLNGDQIEYTLEYSGLEGVVTQSHIHLGQRGVAGGISVWLCQTATNPSPTAGVPVCPVGGGTVTGVITAASVIGPAGQGIATGEFAELVRAMRAGVTYANVHSSRFPAGEIRAQVRLDEDNDE